MCQRDFSPSNEGAKGHLDYIYVRVFRSSVAYITIVLSSVPTLAWGQNKEQVPFCQAELGYTVVKLSMDL